MTNLHPFDRAPVVRVTADGFDLACRRMGRGPDVLFIHGWPLHAATFRDVAARLSDRFTCWLLDLPGCGDSAPPPDWKTPLATHVRAVRAFLGTIESERVALVGHDSGGAIARIVAAEDPTRISALVLGNTEIPGHDAKMVRTYARLLGIPGSTALLGRLMRSRRYLRSNFAFGGCFADRDVVLGEFHRRFIAPQLRDPSKLEAQLDMLRNLEWNVFHDLEPVHARIEAPVRFVWGGADEFFPIAGARAMAKQIHTFDRLVDIPGGKLFAHEEYPQAFAEAAAELLVRQCRADSAPAARASTKG